MTAPREAMEAFGAAIRGTPTLVIDRSEEAAIVARPFPTVPVMVGEPPEPPSIHVDRFLLERDINNWSGFGGSAKTVVLLTTAVCVAVDRPLFGTLAVRRAGAVLLILPEDGQAAARMMLDAIAEGMALEEHERSLLAERLFMVSDDVLVNITTDARRLRDTVLQHNAVLVCIDPLRNVLGSAEENANDVAGLCCDTLRREVCRGAGATIILTAHLRKQGKDTPTDTAPTRFDVRGAGGWIDGSRLAFSVTKRESRITLTSVKANRVASDLRHELDLAIVADPDNAAHWLTCRVTDANAGASSQSLTPGIGRPINANERAALAALDDRHEPGRRVSWSEWVGTAGLKPDTLKSIKARLLDAHLADTHAAGQHRNGGKLYNYSITDRGREALDTGQTLDHPKGERVR